MRLIRSFIGKIIKKPKYLHTLNINISFIKFFFKLPTLTKNPDKP